MGTFCPRDIDQSSRRRLLKNKDLCEYDFYLFSFVYSKISNDRNIFICYIKQILTALYSGNGENYSPSVILRP